MRKSKLIVNDEMVHLIFQSDPSKDKAQIPFGTVKDFSIQLTKWTFSLDVPRSSRKPTTVEFEGEFNDFFIFTMKFDGWNVKYLALSYPKQTGQKMSLSNLIGQSFIGQPNWDINLDISKATIGYSKSVRAFDFLFIAFSLFILLLTCFLLVRGIQAIIFCRN